MIEHEVYYYFKGAIEREIWFANGQLHREDDLPASIYYYELNQSILELLFKLRESVPPIKSKEWYCHGILHRINGPAYITYDENGRITHQQWRINGAHHREDGPALISYYMDGKTEDEHWMVDGKHHRTDGPAYIKYYSNDQIAEKKWYINGEYHRLYGPAYIRYNKNGDYLEKEYYCNGYKITEIVEKLFGCVPDELTKEEQVLLKLSIPEEYFT